MRLPRKDESKQQYLDYFMNDTENILEYPNENSRIEMADLFFTFHSRCNRAIRRGLNNRQ